MRLVVRVLGLDLLDVEWGSRETPPEYDTARALSGGTLVSDRIDAGPTEYLGFTNGREVE